MGEPTICPVCEMPCRSEMHSCMEVAGLHAALAARDERVRELERANEALRGLADARVTIIATMERELAAMRPKAEAAERRAEALRVIGDVHQIGVLMGEADRAILAACPAEEPREVVEPAPAAARWRCEGCGWEGEAADLATSNGHVAIVPDANGDPEPNLCGPCVPITDAQPAGAAP